MDGYDPEKYFDNGLQVYLEAVATTVIIIRLDKNMIDQHYTFYERQSRSSHMGMNYLNYF